MLRHLGGHIDLYLKGIDAIWSEAKNSKENKSDNYNARRSISNNSDQAIAACTGAPAAYTNETMPVVARGTYNSQVRKSVLRLMLTQGRLKVKRKLAARCIATHLSY